MKSAWWRSRTRPGLLAACCLLGLTRICAAQSAMEGGAWRHSFSTAAVAARLPQGTCSVLVVEVGNGGRDLHDAALAVAAALRDSDGVKLVMDASALGAGAANDDQAIAARGAVLPVDLFAVLRALPGGIYDETVIVVDLVGVHGVPIARFEAQRGAAVHDRDPTVVDVALNDTSLADRIRARDEMSAQHIFWRDNMFNQGIENTRHLDGANFYSAVGREDLAEQFRRRRAMQLIILIPSMILNGAGTYTTIIAASANANFYSQSQGFNAGDIAGLAMFGAGLAGLIAVIGHGSSHPVDLDSRFELVRQQNLRFEERLLFPADETRAAPDQSMRLDLVPSSSLRGDLGLALHGKF